MKRCFQVNPKLNRRWTARVVALSLLMAVALPAGANTVTWDNDSGDEKWDTDANWDPAGTPDLALEDVVFPAGGPYVVKLGGNFSLNPGSGRTLTLDSDVTFQGSHYTLTFDDTDQLQGAGTLKPQFQTWRSLTQINAAQPNFSGGFDLIPGARRETYVNASVADAMGTGPANATGYARFDYTWGAQTAVGGTTAGVTVANNAVINLKGTVADPSTLRERFTVNAGGILRGNATQLGYVTRVSSFSPSPSGAEAILKEDAVIVHTSHTGSVNNLGTDTDLIYGLAGTLDDPGFALTVGAGTPWKGLGTDANTGFYSSTSSINDYFKRGTVTIDDGGGSFTELVLKAAGSDYSYNNATLYIGDGSKAPAFVSAPGSGPVALRSLVGDFVLDSPNVDFSGIDQWIVSDDARLILTNALPGDGSNLADLLELVVEAGGKVNTGNGVSYVTSLTLGPDTYTSGTYSNATDPNYLTGTGSIVIIPEPTSLALIGLGAATLLARRRRG